MPFFHAGDRRAASPRRRLMGAFGLLAGAALALQPGQPAVAGPTDPFILNGMLAGQYEAIAFYQDCINTGLLAKPVRELMLTFQGYHKEHAALLAHMVGKLGGQAVLAKPAYPFPAEKLKSQTDVLRMIARLEKNAVDAYLGAVTEFANRDLAKLAASIAGVDAMQLASVRSLLGEAPVQGAFLHRVQP